ncbi:hypothetical protein PG984_010690 [Apiospora sp. TS-2023a]
MVKRSRLAHEPSSSPFDFPLDVLGQGKLPRRIFRVPDDQEKLLRASTSWAEDLFRNPQGLANVPAKVLENLFDFYSRKLEEPELQSSAIPNQSPNALHRKPSGVPSSPSGPRSDLAHEDGNDNSPPGTPISGWDSSPPPVTRSEPPEESDEQPFASQLPEAPAALMQLASSPGDSGSRRDKSSLEQPFETQLPARPPLEAGPAISNLQKRPVFNDFPSSSPAMDEELEIVQPAAYDKELMPPPPHKAIEPNPTPPSAQQVQVPSTFPEPQSSKSVTQLPRVKAARKHRVQPQKAVDVRGLLTDELPTAKPLQTTGLRAPPPKPRPQTCVPESSFSDDASSSVVVPSTEHHKTLHTPSKNTNGLSPKTLVRETQPPLAFKESDRLSQSPKPRPPTSRSLPEIAQTVISSSHGQTPPPINQRLAFSPQPHTFAPLPAQQGIFSAPSSTAPVPASSNGDSKPRPGDPAAQPVEENGTHDQEAQALKVRLADLEDQLKQARLNVAYYEAHARSVSPFLRIPEEDDMVVDEVPQQLEMAENNPEHTPFDQYTNAYPAYKHHGDVWEFVKACVYIQQLQRNRALATYQYDDFIRAWTEGFVPYVHRFDIESSKKPLTAIEWYMETVDNAHFQFRKGIVTRENLETVFEKHPAEANEARTHLRVENHKKQPPRSSLPPAKPVLALPPTLAPVISTAHLLEEVHVGPEEQTEGGEKEAANGTCPTTPAGHPQAQQQLQGSQSDPVDGSIAEARKPKSPENPLRRSTSGIVPSKRPAVDELVVASPKRTASRVLSSRQSGHSTPSATLQPSSTAGGPPRSSAPWLGPRRHANDVDKRAKAFKKYLDKEKRRKQESIVDSSAPLGGTPTSGQRE